MSDDGRFVLFMSNAGDLVAPGVDTNSRRDYFVRDLQTNTTILVTASATSIAAAGVDGNDLAVVLSGNGRYVAFGSHATNMVAGDTNGTSDIFVRDLQTSTTILVSANLTNAGSGNAASGANVHGTHTQGLAVSDDGRYVAFHSDARDLVPDFTDLNGSFSPDVYLRDLVAGTTKLVSTNTGGNGGANQGSSFPPDLALTPDGRFVAFVSKATNLVANVNYVANGENIFVRDVQMGATRLASVNLAGTSGAASALAPQISHDGRYVSFKSVDGTLASGDANNASDVFVRDLQTNTTILASRNLLGTGSGNGASSSRSLELPALDRQRPHGRLHQRSQRSGGQRQ